MVLPRSRSFLADDIEDGDRVFFTLLIVLLALAVGWVSFVPVGVEIRAIAAHVEPSTRVYAVASVVAGRVVAVPLSLGATVKAGEPLLVLDSAHEEEELASARGSLAELERRELALEQEARAELGRLDLEAEAAAIEQASAARQAQGDATARAYAARNLDQSEKLLEVGLISKNERLRLEAESARTSSIADVAALTHDKNTRKLAAARRSGAAREAALAGSLSQLRGQIAEARSRVAHFEDELEERTVRAPADGILRELAALGPGAVIGAGEKFAKVVPEGPGRRVVAQVDSRYLPRLRKGLPATVRQIEARGGYPLENVEAVVVAVGVPTEGGQTVRVELEPRSENLLVGSPVQVEIELERSPLLFSLLRNLRW